MRICRFVTAAHAAPRYGLVDGEIIVVLDEPPFEAIRTGKGRVPLDEATLLAPIEPSKIVGIGLNDKMHATEMSKTIPEEPRIFLKPSTAVIGPEQPIVLPETSQRVEHEAELGVVIGRRATRVMVGNAWQHVLGYTCVNDVTARDIQKRDIHYTRAKGFDSFCPIGPWVETGIHPAPVRVRCLVNDQQRQDGHSANLIRDVPTLIAYITSTMTLLPGDVIATGTYGGTSPLVAGDSVVVEIDGVGTLRNPVMAAPTTGVFARSA
jgi:2-keto-4-pentenoate hydratase/2-oxohepta-3-ene-1,7-dioic acid hydratase in catechol pathway